MTHDSFMTRRVTIGIHKYMFRNCSGKRKALRFDLKESREDFRWRGSRRSFHVEGLKTEMVWEPTVESLVQGIWRLKVSEPEHGKCIELKAV